MFRQIITTLAATATMVFCPTVLAAEADSCGKVRFAQVNWTGVSAKTETAAWMLDQLGYETSVITAAQPMIYQSLASDGLDVFPGLWVPSDRPLVQKQMEKGSIDLVTKNLEGAKYTVAVSRAAWDAGVRHFRDLAKHGDKFDYKVYGIEATSEGNTIVENMIKDDAYGMGEFELVSSSEAGMLAAVRRRDNKNQWTAWLGWAPHPMNINFELEYLEGGGGYWGPGQGAASVWTVAREGFAWQCPNVGQFLENYHFTVKEQSQLAGYVINEEMGYAEAGQKLIQENPALLVRWFGNKGGTTYQTGPIKDFEGEANALEVLRRALGISSDQE